MSPDEGNSASSSASAGLARIWAVVHGSGTDADRAELERLGARDPAVRADWRAACLLDARLRQVFRWRARSDEDLVERAMAAWEQETAAAGPAGGRRRSGRVIDARALFRGTRYRLVWTGLAAAAALLVVLWAPLGPAPGRLTWEQPRFIPAQFRGARPPAAAQALSSRLAGQCQRALRAAVERELAARADAPVGCARLQVSVRELADQGFSVGVKALDATGRTVREWVGDYSSPASFSSQLDASACLIVAELARLAGGRELASNGPCAR